MNTTPQKYKYKLTFWQKLSLIPIRAMWLLMDKNLRKSWHETKKSMEKHECHYTKAISSCSVITKAAICANQ